MIGKKTPHAFLILLLIANITPAKLNATPLPYISLNPTQYEAESPSHSFTINVTINDITDLGAWEFKLNYNTTILDAISVSPTPYTENNTDWVPTDAVGIFHPDGPPTIDDTIGQIWVGALVPAPLGGGLTGSFPLITINFTATEKGNSTLDLFYTGLGDSWGDPIDHTAIDGSVTVIPEFPPPTITPILLITTLAASLLGKKVWSGKRKQTPITK